MKIAIDGTLTLKIKNLLNLYFNFLLKKIKEQEEVIFLVRRDDNPNIGFYVKEYFEKKGYSFYFYSGEDAMERIARDADLFIFFRDKRHPIEPPAARNLVLIEK